MCELQGPNLCEAMPDVQDREDMLKDVANGTLSLQKGVPRYVAMRV